MRAVKLFEEFVKNGTVKTIRKDEQRAKSLVIEAERKSNSLKEKLEKIGIKNENANDYIEDCYDIIMLLVRSKMLLKGYNATGQGAHEAEVSYLKQLGFGESDVQFIDQLRYFRNGILYYGTILETEYAKKVVGFLNKIYPKLKEMCKTKEKK
jgi:hypothetical protein